MLPPPDPAVKRSATVTTRRSPGTNLKLPRIFHCPILCAAPFLALPCAVAEDPLPLWNDWATKCALVAFVDTVSKDGSPRFVPVPERIAVFDNDGTLWPEDPIPFQVAFAFDEVKRMAAANPKLADDAMVKALKEAPKRGWSVVDMKIDWKRVFAFEK